MLTWKRSAPRFSLEKAALQAIQANSSRYGIGFNLVKQKK
jgi:hypothetical protein